MKKVRKIVFIVLAFVALFIIMGDYVAGHTDENILFPEFCPICFLSASTEIPQSVLVFFDELRNVFVDSIVLYFPNYQRLSIVFSLFALRAPPVTL